MAGFESLSAGLEGWYGADLDALPAALKARVLSDFALCSWNHFSPDQRRALAQQWDYKHDPALEPERQRIAELVERLGELEDQIRTWSLVPAPSAKDLQIKESKLSELRRTRAKIDRELIQMEGRSPPALPRRAGAVAGDSSDLVPRYLAYPSALSRLRHRFGATPEELAAWVYWGPSLGGLAAYVNANELDPPPRFVFPSGDACLEGDGFEYVPHLMGCWFRSDEVEAFHPSNRYMSGRDLVQRWSKVAGLDPAAYIRAKISESRLEDHHPIYAATRASYPENGAFPPLELGLFEVAEVEAIEAEDFGTQDYPGTTSEDADSRRARLRRRVQELRAAGTKPFLTVVAEEEGITVSRVKQLVSEKKVKAPASNPADWTAPISSKDRASSLKRKPRA